MKPAEFFTLLSFEPPIKSLEGRLKIEAKKNRPLVIKINCRKFIPVDGNISTPVSAEERCRNRQTGNFCISPKL
ncbi:MAG TPA: hypothetical protein PKA90_11060 [Ignavibacteria bacterium]|nr:hypothetical protein [Ignavibacteria bacterium]HMR40957.1 hypothetical protein [Ignavibacteria bacterium]